MSKQQTKRALKIEIQKLNNIIDERIVKGLSYFTESRRHKDLVARLRTINGGESFTWFSFPWHFA